MLIPHVHTPTHTMYTHIRTLSHVAHTYATKQHTNTHYIWYGVATVSRID